VGSSRDAPRLESRGYRARELQRVGDAWKELFAIEMTRVK